jgi:hypothetical protein
MKGRRKRPIPKKPNGRGFPRIKRSFGYVGGVYVGSINVSSGTNEPITYNRLHEMLDDLADRGESAILLRIRDGGAHAGKSATNGPANRHYEILEVFRSWRNNRHIPNIIGWRDRVILSTLREKLIAASGVHFRGGLAVEFCEAINSKGQPLLQLADLYAGSINRIINRAKTSENPKNVFADFLLDRIRQNAVERFERMDLGDGDSEVHLSL